MAKVDTIQTSFAVGELAPSLFGRTDIAQYANAVAILENFLIKPSGSIISTPGTEYIYACKTGGSTSIARLLQFVFSRTDSYIIEMGVGYFRFFTAGAVVCLTGTTPYEVAHTYSATEIPEIHYCQINDVIYLAHKSHPVRTLTRLAGANWTLADVAFTGGPFKPDNITAITLQASATAGTVTVTVVPTNSNLFVPSGATLGHKNTYWKIGGLRTDSTTGLDVQGYVQLTAITNPSTATATVIKTLTTSAETTDWAEGSWSSVNGYPARVTFHEQRLFLARTNTEPQTAWGSKIFSFTDFAVDGGLDDDAINVQLASNESNDIKWLASGKDLIAGTYGGEFTLYSGDGSPLTPGNTNVKKQTSWGSEAIPPKKIGNFFYYIQRFSQKLRELFYFWDLDTYKSVDKTILSNHIAGDGFIDMAYQQSPDTILWCVTTNGTIATMTREVDQEVQGWAEQNTDGVYESIASIPSATEPHDEIWVIVKRTINSATVRYIERFKSQVVPKRQDQCFYVHSGLTYDAYLATTTPTSTSISLSATAGTSVIVTSSDTYFAVGDIGQRIRAINSSGSTIGELLITNYTSGTIVSGQVKYTFDDTAYAAGYWGLSVNQISGLGHLEAKSVSTLADGGTSKPNQTVSNGTITLPYDCFYAIIGLPYSQKVKTLAQEAGSQRGTSQGKIQRISEVAFKVNRSHKGFKIADATSETDVVSYVEAVSTEKEILYVGTIPDTNFVLERIQFRDPTTVLGTPELLYTGIIPNVSFRGNYAYGVQLLIQNDDPLPLELLALMTTIDTNDKA